MELRESLYGKGLAVIEIERQPGRLILESPVTDLLTGRKLRGKIEVKPYEVLMLAFQK